MTSRSLLHAAVWSAEAPSVRRRKPPELLKVSCGLNCDATGYTHEKWCC